MSRIDSVNFFQTFQNYVSEWRRLEAEYYRIPSWRWIKQLQNIKERENLTRVYVARMKKWGILQDA